MLKLILQIIGLHRDHKIENVTMWRKFKQACILNKVTLYGIKPIHHWLLEK